MANNSVERLHYYQRQYLGAQDFADEQLYQRDMRRRHLLAPHSWGIVTGLELVERTQEVAGDGRDLFLLPGLAVDGYGREIVLFRPIKLDAALFQRFGVANHYSVWIGFEEEATNRSDGYLTNCDPDAYNRTIENYRIYVEPDSPQPDGVVVDGVEVGSDSAELNIPPDLSVPYQELAQDDRDLWLLQLGEVRWDGSRFVAAAAGRLTAGRHYAGLIGADWLAPDGTLLLRDRFTTPLTAADAGVAVMIEGSLQVERDIIAKADVHVDGGQLDFRQSDGSGGEEFAIKRREGGGGEELRIQVPKDTPANRIALGSADSGTFNGSLFILDSGEVGVHTEQPEHPLQIGDGTTPVTFSLRGPDNNAEAAAIFFEDDAGTSERWFQLVYDSISNRLLLKSADRGAVPIIAANRVNGHVGINTTSPAARLHIDDTTDVSLSSHGLLLLGQIDNENIAIDRNEIQARNSGAASTLHLQAEGGALHLHSLSGSSNEVIVDAVGQIGLGNNAPQARLHIATGNDVSLSQHGFVLLGVTNGLNVAFDNNEIQARNNGAAATLFLQAEGGALHIHSALSSDQEVFVQTNGNLGLGTTNPAAKLDVRGAIRHGSGGSLFAAGGAQAQRITSGAINGNVVNGSGSGYSYTRSATGTYQITFSPAFAAPPAVVATSNEDDDHTLSARNITAASCQITNRDLSIDGLQNSQFSFVAIGQA
jgi:hypothetical protein